MPGTPNRTGSCRSWDEVASKRTKRAGTPGVFVKKVRERCEKEERIGKVAGREGRRGTMAGKRKAEGIALLSVYAGSDDEDDAASEYSEEESPRGNEPDVGVKSAVDISVADSIPAASAPSVRSLVAPVSLGIVDYAHDEAAASPEAEEVVESASSGVPLDTEHLVETGSVPASLNGVLAATPGKSTTPKMNVADTVQSVEAGSTRADKNGESREDEEEQASVTADYDVLDNFLPPPPPPAYSEELQSKFTKYLALKKTGRSLNEQLRNTKGYRNPDFLQHAVKYHEIDQIGSCFRKDVFDPRGSDPADYHDALAQEQRREVERKEQERKQVQSQRVEFVRSGIQAAVGVVKPTLPLMQKLVTVTAGAETVKGLDGRASKKSKWDKVEPEGRSAQAIAVDAIAAAHVHASLLSVSTHAGAGYASFAHQRRREAEEKHRAAEKSSLTSSSKVERKTDGRS
ncbi:hypothetical protein R1flu_007929 [Riccia fluitans]|uniref:SAP30-binding protein n=1 Tax=Riccia fluitans TaxID=41844 RepID=A0ABD1Z0I1_9MARC